VTVEMMSTMAEFRLRSAARRTNQRPSQEKQPARACLAFLFCPRHFSLPASLSPAEEFLCEWKLKRGKLDHGVAVVVESRLNDPRPAADEAAACCCYH
jgi:hypothetical protein